MNQSLALYKVLVHLVSEKRQCLARVYDLSQRQMACVTSGDVEALLEVLAAKQRILTELQALDRQLKDYGALDIDRDSIPEEFREAISTVVTECRTMLKQILDMESECSRILEQRKNDVARQLAEFHDFMQARVAYRQPGEIINELDVTS